MKDEDKVRSLFGFGERRELPSRYFEIGFENVDDKEPDEDYTPNYYNEPLPFC